jgi:sigma-E factor negative regulatory protein RseC
VATEEGIVVRRDASGTWVRTVRGESCAACTSRGACHSLGGGREEAEVAVLNPVGAQPGDAVVLKLETPALLKATFVVYLFPVLMLLLGALLGEWIATAAAIDSPLPAAAAGFGALALGLLVMKAVAARLAAKPAYRPRIVRVLLKPAAPPENRG